MTLLHAKHTEVARMQWQRRAVCRDVSDSSDRYAHRFTAKTSTAVPVEHIPNLSRLHEVGTHSLVGDKAGAGHRGLSFFAVL